MARLTADQQIAELQQLNQKAAAWLLGYTSKNSLSQKSNCPRNADGTYHAKEIVEWGVSDGILKAADLPTTKPQDQLAEIKVAKLAEQLVDHEQIQTKLKRLGDKIKGLGDEYRRREILTGDEAAELLNDIIRRCM